MTTQNMHIYKGSSEVSLFNIEQKLYKYHPKFPHHKPISPFAYFYFPSKITIMSLPNIYPQTYWFYRDGWTGELDNFFIDKLVRYKKLVKWGGMMPPRPVLESTRRALNDKFELQLTIEEIGDRVKLLQRRYNSFKVLINTTGALYHSRENFIQALDETWTLIFEKDEFAQAYYREGDPDWNRLLILFAFNEIKDESDSDAKEEDDEVNSPGMKTTRRKLFVQEYVPVDEASGIYGGSSTGGGGFPSQNAFPPNDNMERSSKKPQKTTETSSCASTSPSRWWKKIIK